MECFWKVRIWDKDGSAIMHGASRHTGQWDCLKRKTGLLNGSGHLTRLPHHITGIHFIWTDVPERATYYLASLGYFELYINGEKVGKEVLAPAVSNFSERSYYQTYDVAGYLKKGKNSIGIWMGTGWYSPGLPGVRHHSPVVRAQLEIPDETDQRIVTDTSWETKAKCKIPHWRMALGKIRRRTCGCTSD